MTRRTVTEGLAEASADGETTGPPASTRDSIYGLVVVVVVVVVVALLFAALIGLLSWIGFFATCCTQPAPSPW
jgi:hypothetical protein